MANGFGAPPSPYPDMGGDSDIPPWLQALINRQAGPMAGQIPGQDTFSTTTPTAGGGNQPPPGPLALPGATPALPAGAVARGPNDQIVSAPGGKQPSSTRGMFAAKRIDSARAAADDSMLYPFKAVGGARGPTPVADPDMLYPARAATPGYGPPPQPAYNPLAGGSANTGAPPAVTPVANPDMLYPHRMIAGAPSNGAVPNLGYYRPTMGNAQGNPTWVPQGAQGAPQMFRGPLALPGSQNYYAQPTGAPAAPASGPIAPGAGAPWWQKLFGGGQPAA